MPEYFISYEDAHSDLLSAATYLAERIKSGDGRAEAMTAIVPRYLATSNVDLAAELANTLEDPFTRDKLLIEVSAKCAELDDDEYALQLAEVIDDFGMRSQALEKIALQKVSRGQIEKAVEITESMSHPDYVFASAAARLASEGNSGDARDMLGRAEFPGARVSALQAMAISELAAGNKDQCVLLLEQATEAAGEIEHNEERIRTLCDIGNHYVEAARNDLAIGAYDMAKGEAEQLDNIHRDTFLAGAALGFLHAGSIDLADRTLDLITDKTQIANCLLAFARYYWERQERDDAFEVLDEAYQILRSQRDIETRDSRARFALFASIAAQFAGFEKGERAIETAQVIEDANQQTSALSQIAAILTLRREDEQARIALYSIADDSDRVFALIGMSDAKERNGDRTDAAGLLDEAMHLAEEVPQLTARLSIYYEIARRYSDLGDVPKATEILDIYLQTIAAIRDESTRAVGLAHLAELFAADGLELQSRERQSLLKIINISS